MAGDAARRGDGPGLVGAADGAGTGGGEYRRGGEAKGARQFAGLRTRTDIVIVIHNNTRKTPPTRGEHHADR